MDINYEDLGKQIKKIRKRKGISQAELASRADTSPQHISNVENARTKIGLEKLVCLANAMEVTLDSLICGSVKQSRVVYNEEISAIIEEFSDVEMRVLPDYLRYFSYVCKSINQKND